MNETEIRKIVEASLLAGRVDEVMDMAAPMLRLIRSGDMGNEQPLGASRIGGLPDLPPSITWPVDDGRPLDFIAQIDLAEAAAVAQLPDLPPSGRLAFFYDTDNQPWGFDPREREGWRALYFEDDGATLQRVRPPAPVASTRPQPPGLLSRILGRNPPPRIADSLEPFPANRVRFEAAISMPNLYEEFDQEFDSDLWDAVEDIMYKLDIEFDDPDHQLGGHPAQIQGDMKLECQLASNGLYCGDGEAYESEQGLALKPGAAEWRLLLQIDSDEEGPGWMWGDLGCIYFWIRGSDLAARNFDNVWCVLQCS